jgi:hypothetical protein
VAAGTRNIGKGMLEELRSRDFDQTQDMVGSPLVGYLFFVRCQLGRSTPDWWLSEKQSHRKRKRFCTTAIPKLKAYIIFRNSNYVKVD